VALDPSFIGRCYPAVLRYQVGAGKIREFADAIGDPNPIYRDVEAAKAAGHPGIIAPPTFVTIINLQAIETLVADPDLGLDWSRVVHGEQNFAYHRPVLAGDHLVLDATIEDMKARAGNDMVTIRADISTVDGESVSTARALIVARGTAE
jgi:acyl dehydratase